MLGGAGEDQADALSQAKTAQIQSIMKLFAVSLWFTCQQANLFMRGLGLWCILMYSDVFWCIFFDEI